MTSFGRKKKNEIRCGKIRQIAKEPLQLTRARISEELWTNQANEEVLGVMSEVSLRKRADENGSRRRR
jgi:hypothetical protein